MDIEPTETGRAVYGELEEAVRHYVRSLNSTADSPLVGALIGHDIREWPGMGRHTFSLHLTNGEVIEVELRQVK